MKKTMTFSATGDSLILRRIPEGYSGFEEVSNYIKSAEARMTNLETVLSNFDCYASAYCGGIWVNATSDVLQDLISYGFNLYGWANNHTMDYSYEGLKSTKKALDEAGVSHAGAGMDLEEASSSTIINLPSGQVGMISICSSSNDAARAGSKTKDLPGRPGLNPLRYKAIYTITPEQMNTLREIAEKTKINGRRNLSKIEGFTVKEPEGTFDFGSILFREGDKEGKNTYPNMIDINRTKKAIEDALSFVDYVVVMVHSHEIKGDVNTQPDYFFEEFARTCIDSGACAVIGAGTHQLKAIEMYKNRPIFYSLGNFIFQTDYIKLLPSDYYERHGYPYDYTAEQVIEEHSKRTERGLNKDVNNFRSVIPFFEMNGDKLTKLVLKPIELGFGKSNPLYGLPYPAGRQASKELFDYLDNLNKEYGTVMKMKNGLFEVGV
jgi:poly-gamma-glutamate capsule biosynthesis protein CapA/YwtB (metallophosphatase superfamily)